MHYKRHSSAYGACFFILRPIAIGDLSTYMYKHIIHFCVIALIFKKNNASYCIVRKKALPLQRKNAFGV